MESKDSLISKALGLTNDALCEFLSKSICCETDICGSCRWLIDGTCRCDRTKRGGNHQALDAKKCNAWSVVRLDLDSYDIASGMRLIITDTYSGLIITESIVRVHFSVEKKRWKDEYIRPHPQYGTENDNVRHAYRWLALHAKPIHFVQIACICGMLDDNR